MQIDPFAWVLGADLMTQPHFLLGLYLLSGVLVVLCEWVDERKEKASEQ